MYVSAVRDAKYNMISQMLSHDDFELAEAVAQGDAELPHLQGLVEMLDKEGEEKYQLLQEVIEYGNNSVLPHVNESYQQLRQIMLHDLVFENPDCEKLLDKVSDNPIMVKALEDQFLDSPNYETAQERMSEVSKQVFDSE